MFRGMATLIGRVTDTASHMMTAVLLASLLFSAVEFAFHVLLASLGMPPIRDAAIDGTLVGLSFGLVLWLFLAGVRERRARVKYELDRIAELNHEIRNALEVIAGAHFDADAMRKTMVLDSVTRIEAALKRIFPG
jgi:hypothetical protein